MLILGIETSAHPASVSILQDGKIIAEVYIHTSFTHSKTLMPMVNSALELTELSISDVDLIAVSNGPGSFTGVRIGIASAKGLAFPNNTNCIGISSLEALAYNLYDTKSNLIIYSCIDARVKQSYNAVYKLTDGKISVLRESRVISNEDIINEIEALPEKSSVVLVGDNLELFSSLKDKVKFAGYNQCYQRASSVAMAASLKYDSNTNYDSALVQPVYLQLPQATRELNKRKENK